MTPTQEAAEREALARRLRDACASVRGKSYPLSDLIPLMQQAADALSQQGGGAVPEGKRERIVFYERMMKDAKNHGALALEMAFLRNQADAIAAAPPAPQEAQKGGAA